MIFNKMMSNINVLSSRMLNMFFKMLIALELSQKIGTLCMNIPESFNCCLIHKICAQQLPIEIYSTLAVERATKSCFLQDHDASMFPMN